MVYNFTGLSTTTTSAPLSVGDQPRHHLGNHHPVGAQTSGDHTPTQNIGGKKERQGATTDPLAEPGWHGSAVHALRGHG